MEKKSGGAKMIKKLNKKSWKKKGWEKREKKKLKKKVQGGDF